MSHYATETGLWSGALPEASEVGARESIHASRNCPECSGMGMATRFHDDLEHGRPGTFQPYCHRCCRGRFIERAHRERHPDVRRCMRDLAEAQLAWLRPMLYGCPPDLRDEMQALARRHEVPQVITRAMVAELARAMDAKHGTPEQCRKREFQEAQEHRRKRDAEAARLHHDRPIEESLP